MVSVKRFDEFLEKRVWMTGNGSCVMCWAFRGFVNLSLCVFQPATES